MGRHGADALLGWGCSVGAGLCFADSLGSWLSALPCSRGLLPSLFLSSGTSWPSPGGRRRSPPAPASTTRTTPGRPPLPLLTSSTTRPSPTRWAGVPGGWSCNTQSQAEREPQSWPRAERPWRRLQDCGLGWQAAASGSRKGGLSIPFSVCLLSALVRARRPESRAGARFSLWRNAGKTSGKSLWGWGLAAGVRARALLLGGRLRLWLRADLWGREGTFPRTGELSMWERGGAGAHVGPLLLSCSFPWPPCRFQLLPLQACEITAALWLCSA